MRPQEPCGDRSPWAPGFCEHFHDLGCRPDGEVEGMCRRCLEGEIGGGPDVDPAKTGEKIDIGSPAADAGDRPEPDGTLLSRGRTKALDDRPKARLTRDEMGQSLSEIGFARNDADRGSV